MNDEFNKQSWPYSDEASLRSFALRIAFENEVSATPLGHRTYEMRQEARLLHGDGKEEEAFALFERAAALHTPDDTSAAAAMCWYDLAETYTRRRDGIRFANLRSAESLYRRALSCPAVERDLHRSAKVRNALASCLRHLAAERHNDGGRKELLSESSKLFKKAIDLARQCGEVEMESLAGYLHNYGNLQAQRGKLDAAIKLFDDAGKHARRVLREVTAGDLAHLRSQILVHGAEARTRRSAAGDYERAASGLREAIAIGHPKLLDRAHLALVDTLRKMGPAYREAAVRALQQVRYDRLDPLLRPQWVSAHENAGLDTEALRVLHLEIHRIMHDRQGTLADHTADTMAVDAQRSAHWAARIEAKQGNPLNAFITLEYSAAPRFAEAVGHYCERADRPASRALHEETAIVGSAASLLDQTADWLAIAPPEARRGALQIPNNIATTVDTFERPADARMRLRLDALQKEAFERARHHADPAGALKQEAQKLKKRAMKLGDQLHAMAPELNQPKPWLGKLNRTVLIKLLKEHPGYALIHLSIVEDLLVVAVWLEGDELVAKAHRTHVPRDLFSALARDRRDDANLTAIQHQLSAIDLSSALPPDPMEHGVLLPSFVASFLPLAALGPPGKTLLDRFHALSWMPCLSPLFERQPPCPPRNGTVSIAPGGTDYHDIALSTIGVPHEAQLIGDSATVPNVLDAACTADVMCFFAHGKHKGKLGPELDLAGGKLERSHLLSRWIGMERVELWACSSGVNLPYDPLTPPVDEAFGLDYEILRVGVRSAIGTLWPVSDLETAVLVARYRLELNRGKSAPRALADAQRAVRDNPAEVLRSLDPKARPVETNGLSSDRPKSAHPRSLFATPLSWGGFRFCGVAEKRPLRAWTAEDERELTPEETAKLDEILSEEEPKRISLDDWQNAQLAEAADPKLQGSPSPERAIRVARLYRDRLFSSRAHNLLSGLAWLHEAMAAGRASESAETPGEARQRLALEAAWLWLDLARGERLSWLDWILLPQDPIAAERAHALIETLADSPHVRALRAWLHLLRAPITNPKQFELTARAAWIQMSPVLKAHPEGHDGVRTWTAACELALVMKETAPEVVAECLERVRELPKMTAGEMAEIVPYARLNSAIALLAANEQGSGSGDDIDEMRQPDAHNLPAFECVRQGLNAWIALWHAPLAQQPEHLSFANKYFDHVEGMHWGYPDDNRLPLIASSGTLGAAYRQVLGTWTEQVSRSVGANNMAIHVMASLQPATDLRLAAIARWSRLCGHIGEQAGDRLGRLALFLRDRETLFERLEEAALLPDYALLAQDPEHPQWRPSRLDPFARPVRFLQSGTTTDDLVPWFLGESCKDAPPGPPDARTAAFSAVRKAELLTSALSTMWNDVCEVGEKRRIANIDASPVSFPKLFDTGIRLADREDILRRIPPRWVVITLSIGTGGRLVVASVRRNKAELLQNIYATDGPDGAKTRHALARLHCARTPGERRTLWTTIEEVLSPALSDALPPAIEREAPVVAIVAPGSLRSVPYVGVRVRGRPLFEFAAGVLHVPSIGVEPRAEGGNREACAFGKDPAEGDTTFGEAVVETLRRWFEPSVIRPPREVTTDIIEAGQIEALAPQLGALRLYGSESSEALSPVLAALNIGGRRKFSDQNTRGTFLPRCEVVELWADTAGAGPAMNALRDDRDRIPGLARSFLLSGAAHVVDLAWPIPDIVKALLCERFGALRKIARERPPVVLAAATMEIAKCLGDLHAAAPALSSIRDVLGWLDEARRARARDLGLDAAWVIRFADRADAPSIRDRTLTGLLDELTDPTHLAAVRCWGWLCP
ncbi:MAG: CHAT domain-containing protein [Polyangiaceae bacterium]|nr:CHAT domain-containing protein [Polyangiaceae bacterium]